MSVSKIAIRYAKSLFELAKERAQVEEVNEDMKQFYNCCVQTKELAILLKSPIISGNKKIKILKSIFADIVNPLTMSIFEIIVRKKRESILKEIAEEFFSLYKKEKGIITTTIISSTKLSNELKSKIINVLTNETCSPIDLKENINADLIGGFIINLGDKQIDTSIASKLKRLKREFELI